jgi:Uma2 family endonuclease
MSTSAIKLPTDTWAIATWDEFIQTVEDPAYHKAKGYYYKGRMRVEAMSVGPDHAKDNGVIATAVTLFAALKRIPLNCLDNCSYRKTGVRECQPDISYYVGARAQFAPTGTAIANLDLIQPPDLAIEISDSTISDDKGEKRLLYEDIHVSEYWVVDVQRIEILAFEIIASGGSRRITSSQVLAGLEISLLEEALRLSRQTDHAQAIAWLITQFQS